MIEEDILKLIENRRKILEKQWKSYESLIKNKEPHVEICSGLKRRHYLLPFLSGELELLADAIKNGKKNYI